MSTIAAISTGLTPAGIAIIRISGSDAIGIADQCFAGKKKLCKVKTHTIHYGVIKEDDEVLDEVLVSVMKEPKTFTGEDTVEINCHGGMLVATRILNLLLKKGAEPAEPGEFTKRAFLNGRMDLSKAEAVMDVISAKNNYALKAGVRQLRGDVSLKIKEIREKILDECAFIEAAIDDPEHYDLTGYEEELKERIQPIVSDLQTLLERSDYGSVLKEGVRTVIAGAPNAGKSSLLNLLSGFEKAIVTDIAGTTRDILEVPVILKDISLILLDTAGLRETEDTVEKIGVERAKAALSEADLVLYVIDSTKGFCKEDEETLRTFSDKPVIRLFNKADLVEEKTSLSAGNIVPGGLNDDAGSNASGHLGIRFSCVTGLGKEDLEKEILALFSSRKITQNEDVVLTNERQKVLLRKAIASMKLVLSGIDDALSEEFLTVDLVNAYKSLGEIIGEEVTDDVVNRVFEKFCMGK